MNDPQNATRGLEPWTQANDVESASDEEMGEALSLRIIHLLRLCWMRRGTIILILAAGILLSFLYAISRHNMYTSTTTLMAPDNSSSSNSSLMSLLSTAGPAASMGNAALGMRTPGAVFTGILGSRSVQEGLVTRLDLVHYYKSKFIEDACRQLAAATAIHEEPKSGIIAISITDKDPVFASKIAQGYVEELDHVLSRNSTSAARRERIFLEARLKEIKQDLDDSAKALSQFSTKNKTFDLAVQGKAMVDSGTKIQDQMIFARSELAALQQTYSEDNVRVRAARARIAELQLQLGSVLGATEGNKNDLSGSSYPSISELPALGVNYSDLGRRVRVEEALWEALTRQYEAAKVQEAREIPTVRVLDAANVPQHKSSPFRALIMIFGTMLSFIAACIYVLAASFWQGMDEQDERKILVTDIVSNTLNPEKWRRAFSRK
jgi:uncharacterized protein involved in exopolysaccharide biosynthesis